MLKRQFLQGDAGLFDQALGDHELTAIMSDLVPPHRERIYPPLETLRLFVGQMRVSSVRPLLRHLIIIVLNITAH